MTISTRAMTITMTTTMTTMMIEMMITLTMTTTATMDSRAARTMTHLHMMSATTITTTTTRRITVEIIKKEETMRKVARVSWINCRRTARRSISRRS